MIRLFFFLSCSLLICACNNNTTVSQLKEVDSLISKDMDDSASITFRSINPKSISDGEQRAYYNLLNVQLRFRNGEIIPNDSLIDYSVDYYHSNANEQQLAKAYYFKGRMAYKRKETEKALVCLKKSEDLSIKTNNHLLTSRIYLILSQICTNGGESNMALEYSKKAVRFAELSNNNEQIVYCLNCLSFDFGRINEEDSSWFYKKKYIPLIKHLPANIQAALYANIGSDYEKIGTAKAKAFVLKAIKMSPQAHAFQILGDIYRAEGNGKEAENSYRQALKLCTDLHRKINILNDLREYKLSAGDNREAANIADEVILLSDSIRTVWKKDSVKDIQARIEAGKHIQKEKNNKKNAITIATILLMGALAMLALYIIKKRKDKRTIAEQQNRIEDYSKTAKAYCNNIEKLKKKDKEQQKEMSDLKRDMKQMGNKQKKEIERIEHDMAEKMAAGHKLYESVKNGGKMTGWSKSERDMFIAYCLTISSAPKLKDGLTTNQTLYSILAGVGYDDDAISAIMSITPGALRTMKSRMKG